jgi:hypothetical protein
MVEFSLFTLDMAHELVLVQNTLVLSTHTPIPITMVYSYG